MTAGPRGSRTPKSESDTYIRFGTHGLLELGDVTGLHDFNRDMMSECYGLRGT
jgi:hypothetical protein